MLGFDPVRLGEYLEASPDTRTAGATVYGRPGDPGSQGVLTWLADHSVPAILVDVDQHPLTHQELWQLLVLPGNANVRTPYTLVDGAVVLGNDRRRLEELLASRPHS